MRRRTVRRVVSQLTRNTIAIVMAGGRGQRLQQLTDHRAKPATPFGGKYRIIDFSLSNCVNSGLRQIIILTQYKAQSLIRHVERGWGYLHGEFGEFIELVPAQQKLGEIWYRGTADAVYQNLDILDQHRPELVLVLAGDHVYKMDYGPLLALHAETGADITVGGVQVPLEQAHEFGLMNVDSDHRIVSFDEKPAQPKPMPGRADVALASMGIYVFGTELLRNVLIADAADPTSVHDFGRNIIPRAIAERRVFAYPFEDVETKAQRYWRDVGTVDAYYDANMELIYVSPELNLYDEAWPIWTHQEQVPSAKFVLDDPGRRGTAVNSMIAGGCIISGATVRESLLSVNVMVDECTDVYRSVILPDVEIGRSCIVHRAIVDEGSIIPHGMEIGKDRELDKQRFYVSEKGITLVTRDMLDKLRHSAPHR
jgi:glucose-1-phosphate adenylyltransferase